MTNKRSRLLAAAAKIVSTKGASAMTLEEVALRAGVSKGGLLYHFPSKKKLILALVEHQIERFDTACATFMQHPKRPGAYTLAYLQATLTDDASTASGIISAVADDPKLLAPLRKAYQRWQAALESDGIDPALSTMVRLVADGLWFSSMIGAPALKPKLLRQVADKIRGLVGEQA